MAIDSTELGLHFITGLVGTSLSKHEAELLRQLRPAGIILFARNIEQTASDSWISRLKTLINEAQNAAEREEFFVSIDHEGGRVHRFPPPVTHFPAARNWKDDSFEVGCAMGQELRALGFNLSFAPVLDVHSEAANEVIGARAFSDTPAEAASWAMAYAEGLEAQGVLSCGKHFPGHGATIADSHFELPRLESSREVIDRRELLPFRSYCRAGASLIMTAHVLYPALDSLPATLSANILQGVLRKELEFEGCIISDDMEMAALKHYFPGERAVKAITAGVDILLEGYPKDLFPAEVALEMAEGLLAALDKGEIDQELFLESGARVKKLFSASKTLQAGLPELEAPSLILGNPSHKQLADKLK